MQTEFVEEYEASSQVRYDLTDSKLSKSGTRKVIKITTDSTTSAK